MMCFAFVNADLRSVSVHTINPILEFFEEHIFSRIHKLIRQLLAIKSFEVFAMKIVVYYLLQTKVRNISILGPTDELWFCSFGFMCCFFNLFAAWAAWHSRSSIDIGQWSKYHRESHRWEIHFSLKPSLGINFQIVLVFQKGLKSSCWFFPKPWWCFLFDETIIFSLVKNIILIFQNLAVLLQWFIYFSPGQKSSFSLSKTQHISCDLKGTGLEMKYFKDSSTPKKWCCSFFVRFLWYDVAVDSQPE